MAAGSDEGAVIEISAAIILIKPMCYWIVLVNILSVTDESNIYVW